MCCLERTASLRYSWQAGSAVEQCENLQKPAKLHLLRSMFLFSSNIAGGDEILRNQFANQSKQPVFRLTTTFATTNHYCSVTAAPKTESAAFCFECLCTYLPRIPPPPLPPLQLDSTNFGFESNYNCSNEMQ